MLRFVGRFLAAALLFIGGAAQAQVVISQVYGGGGNSGATLRSDFIELHNNGITAVSLSGWSVQYASSSGTTWSRTNLSGSIAAGGYLLIKQADGAGGTVNLPTPDVTGTIAMSATAGKIALVNNQTTLTGSCPTGASIIDFVGFGSANCSETSPTPAPSNTLAVLRADSGCTDTGNNNADFATGAPSPRNTASPIFVCGASPTLLSVNDVSALEGDSGTTAFTFGIGLSQPAGPGGVTFDIATANGTAIAGSDYIARSATITIPAGNNSATFAVDVLGDTAPEADETFFVNLTNVVGATVADGQGQGTLLNDDVAIVPIHDIQGNGLFSPLNGAVVTTEGIVTAQKFNNGFFLQTADAEVDADPNTSEGIFVFTSTAPPASAAVGNRVRVTGTVTEFTPSSNLNQLSITEIVSVSSVVVMSSGNVLPAPITLSAADFGAGATPGTAEKYEGMRVNVPSARVVAASDGNITESSANSSTTGVFHVVLDGVGRPFREPGIGAMDVFPIPGGKTPPRFDTNQERLMVRSRGQIGATSLALDVDAQIANMTGVLDYFSGTWALLPDVGSGTASGGRTPAAVADARPEDVTIAGANLLRFFDEVNDSNGGPTLTAAALDKRLTKTSLAICDYLKAPDILGVVEVENLRVLGMLADRINSTCARAPQYVPYLVQGNDVGGINVGFLVSTRAVGAGVRVEVLEVTQFGKNTVFNNPDGSTALLNDRPPLLLRAIVHAQNGATYPVTVIVNHLRSLNGLDDTAAGSSGWPTEGDRVRNKRGQQAMFLANLVHARQIADPNERIVLLGDFNAFEFNDGYVDVMGIVRGNEAAEPNVISYFDSPITAPLIDGSELILDPTEKYSYEFEGSAQTLDHVVINEPVALGAADIRVDHARINADFGVHHYGVAGNAIRVSDHDPVRIAISVAAFRSADLGVTASAAPASLHIGGTASFTIVANNAGPNDVASTSVALVFDAVVTPTMTVPAGWTCAAPVQTTTTTVTCTAAGFANGASATFGADVFADASLANRSLNLQAAIASTTADPANANNQASATVSVIAEADLGVTAGNGGPVDVGGTASFAVNVNNAGPDPAAFASVALVFDALIAPSVVAPAGWACAAPVQDATTTTVTCTTPTFVSGGSAGFTATVPVGPAQGNGTLSLAAAVASQYVDPDNSDNLALTSLAVRAIVDLSVAVAAGASPVDVGGTVAYAATVSNAGPSATGAATLTLVFDALVAANVTAPAGWNCAAPTQAANATTVVCSATGFAAGASASFSASFPATAALAGTQVRLTATAASATADTAPGNNSASAAVQIRLAADLSVRMVGRSGRAGVFLIAVQNAGPSAAQTPSLVVSGNLLPRNASLIPSAGWTCTPVAVSTGFRFNCTTTGSLAAGGEAVFGMAVAGRGPQTVTITAAVSSPTPDSNPANNTAQRVLVGGGLPDECMHRYCRR